MTKEQATVTLNSRNAAQSRLATTVDSNGRHTLQVSTEADTSASQLSLLVEILTEIRITNEYMKQIVGDSCEVSESDVNKG